MKNRNVEFFNLSFLDLLSGALASIIFLFIIVPKGELTINTDPVTVVYDTIQNQFYGSIPEGIIHQQPPEPVAIFGISGKMRRYALSYEYNLVV